MHGRKSYRFATDFLSNGGNFARVNFYTLKKSAPENMLLDLAFSVWVVYSQLRDSFFKSRLNRIDISVKYSMISRMGTFINDVPY